MPEPRAFLTASWRQVAMINYVIVYRGRRLRLESDGRRRDWPAGEAG
jgi:hypothetical protein